MHAHLLQYDIAWEDVSANQAHVKTLASSSAIAPGDLVVLPEMFDTGFSMRTEITARDYEQRLAFLCAMAHQYQAWVVASIACRVPSLLAPKNCVNRALVCSPTGDVALHYDKVHPFSFGREGERFVGGYEVRTVSLGNGPDAPVLCPQVCYDLRFPECFRAGVDRGAEVFALVANWPAPRHHHWRALCIARAIENQAIVIGLNRCGTDPGHTYAGGSLVVSERGDVLFEADEAGGVSSVPIDIGSVRAWRAEFPALADRCSWTLGPEGARAIGQKTRESSG